MSKDTPHTEYRDPYLEKILRELAQIKEQLTKTISNKSKKE
jgi:hypothetical protein